MSKGMQNRELVLEAIEDFGFDALNDGDVNLAVSMLNRGRSETEVLEALEQWNAERE